MDQEKAARAKRKADNREEYRRWAAEHAPDKQPDPATRTARDRASARKSANEMNIERVAVRLSRGLFLFLF